MAYRITKTRLANRFAALAEYLGWDIQGPRYTQRADGRGCDAKIGHTMLEHNSVYGWNINRIVNTAGGESRVKESCSAAEMDAWLAGALFAAYEMNRAHEKAAA